MNDSKAKRFVMTGIIMLIAMPFIRIAEGIIRFIFMREFYGSVLDAILRDIWFSSGWRAYVQTPAGMTLTIFYFVWLFAGAAAFYFGLHLSTKETSNT